MYREEKRREEKRGRRQSGWRTARLDAAVRVENARCNRQKSTRPRNDLGYPSFLPYTSMRAHVRESAMNANP